MSSWGIPWKNLIDLIAVFIAIGAFVAIGIAFKKKETHGGTLGLFLVATTAVLLIVASYYDVRKGYAPIRRFDIGPVSVVLTNMQEQLNIECLDQDCNQKQCLEITHLSRDWHSAECNAIEKVSTRLDAIKKKELGVVRTFKEFELYRKEIIRQIESSFEKVQQAPGNEANYLKLQNSIAELVVFDQVIFNEVESVICSD